mmetsp:Transcript_106187/g.300283  ORF Transcript_106187/g.300283 Transcript_106187/m.300283 type:complete len:210 (+) Transcript_106187:277-906(+)
MSDATAGSTTLNAKSSSTEGSPVQATPQAAIRSQMPGCSRSTTEVSCARLCGLSRMQKPRHSSVVKKHWTMARASSKSLPAAVFLPWLSPMTRLQRQTWTPKAAAPSSASASPGTQPMTFSWGIGIFRRLAKKLRVRSTSVPSGLAAPPGAVAKSQSPPSTPQEESATAGRSGRPSTATSSPCTVTPTSAMAMAAVVAEVFSRPRICSV